MPSREAPADFPPPQPIIYEAYGAITNSLQKILNRKGIDITREQLMILNSLRQKAGENQSSIASAVVRDRRNLTKTIKILEQKGLIVRTADAKDKRAFNVYLSSEGNAVLDAVADDIQLWRRQICRGLTREDLDDLFRVLRAIICNISEL